MRALKVAPRSTKFTVAAPQKVARLTDERIARIAEQHLKAISSNRGQVWYEGEIAFARAIIAEVNGITIKDGADHG